MSFLEKQFHLQEKKTTVKTEILAGVTTFMTMAYIIFVNPNILSETGMPKEALISATCIASALATFLMAIIANYPIALAPGMGLNAFFAFTVVLGMGLDWRVALTAIFIEGLFCILISITELREAVVNSIPKSLKIAISGGIGLFIAFIGLQSAGIIVGNPATLVTLTSFKGNMPACLALGGLLLMVVLEIYKVTGALLIGIIAVTAAAAGMNLVVIPASFVSAPPSPAPIFAQLQLTDLSMFTDSRFWVIVFTFFFVDFFDTIGTLVGVCSRSGMLDEQGRIPNAKRVLIADSFGVLIGSLFGTSTVTSYVESASGVAQGGRTGLSSVVTALLFLGALYFMPVAGMVPAYATAPALVMVGIYMMMGLRELNFDDWSELIPALVAFIMMPLSYSIAAGIEFGIVAYALVKILTGKSKDISPVLGVLALLFILKEAFL